MQVDTLGAMVWEKPPRGPVHPNPFCPLDGQLIKDHTKCSQCGILVGPEHEEKRLYGSLCGDCLKKWRRKVSTLRLDPEEKMQ